MNLLRIPWRQCSTAWRRLVISYAESSKSISKKKSHFLLDFWWAIFKNQIKIQKNYEMESTNITDLHGEWLSCCKYCYFQLTANKWKLERWNFKNSIRLELGSLARRSNILWSFANFLDMTSFHLIKHIGWLYEILGSLQFRSLVEFLKFPEFIIFKTRDFTMQKRQKSCFEETRWCKKYFGRILPEGQEIMRIKVVEILPKAMSIF